MTRSKISYTWFLNEKIFFTVETHSNSENDRVYANAKQNVMCHQVDYFVFKFTCQLNNKEYLIAIFRYWPLSCKHFLSEHFAENGIIL